MSSKIIFGILGKYSINFHILPLQACTKTRLQGGAVMGVAWRETPSPSLVGDQEQQINQPQ